MLTDAYINKLQDQNDEMRELLKEIRINIENEFNYIDGLVSKDHICGPESNCDYNCMIKHGLSELLNKIDKQINNKIL